jgi:hypothetical protein
VRPGQAQAVIEKLLAAAAQPSQGAAVAVLVLAGAARAALGE